MSVLLVTYDLNRPGQDYSQVYEVIKKYPWKKLSESSYVIETEKEPRELYTEIDPHIDSNDRILIVTIAKPWWGLLSDDVIQWLQSHLKSSAY